MYPLDMSDVTQILQAIERGEPQATDELLPIVYEELRSLAAQQLSNENPGHTLQATALVHEAYLKLVGGGGEQGWNSRGHFFAAAAEAMRRILVDRARRRSAQKRGGGMQRIDLGGLELSVDSDPEQMLALDEALGRLREIDAQAESIVNLRFFAGLTLDQAARSLGVSERTAYRDWAFAKSWLYREMSGNLPE